MRSMWVCRTLTITKALETENLRLHRAEHWPIGTIATQCRVHHDTVRRVLRQARIIQPIDRERNPSKRAPTPPRHPMKH